MEKVVKRIKNLIKKSGPFAIFFFFYFKVLRGYRNYCRMLRACSVTDDKTIFLLDYTGSGDTYLTCGELLRHEMIGVDTVFVCPSGAPAKLVKLFGFQKVIELRKDDILMIRAMEHFCGMSLHYVPILYWSPAMEYLGVLRRMEGHRGINFLLMLRVGLELSCGLTYCETPFQHPQFQHERLEIDAFFQEYQLIPGRTVLMAPYMGMNTPRWIVDLLLKETAIDLMQKGYCVCTNSNGSSDELPIPGTKAVFVPYNLVSAFIERAGAFIGTRSGLCDIISGARHCKKIILYPNRNSGISVHTWLEFFSLNSMSLCQDAVEIQYDESCIEEIKEQILASLYSDQVLSYGEKKKD